LLLQGLKHIGMNCEVLSYASQCILSVCLVRKDTEIHLVKNFLARNRDEVSMLGDRERAFAVVVEQSTSICAVTGCKDTIVQTELHRQRSQLSSLYWHLDTDGDIK